MALRRFLKSIFAAAFIFFSLNMSFSENIRFIQRLSWTSVDSALEYRVEVQNLSSQKTIIQKTEQNCAEFSLESGEYRYRVSAIDVLEKKSAESDWVSFSVQSNLLAKSDDTLSQTLSWKKDENAWYYRVELQNLASNKLAIFETESNSASLSLVPGKYRYRVMAYDVLKNSGAKGEWLSFEVFQAKKPEIKNINEKLKNLGKTGKVALSVDIKNISEGSKVELVRETQEGSFSKDGENAENSGGNEDKETGTVYFDTVPAGKWRLRITNPSGLTTESEPFEVKEKKKKGEEIPREYKHFTISLGGGILFNPYDGTLLERNNVNYFGQEIIPSLSAKVQYLPFTKKRDHFGFALSFLGTQLFYRSDAYKETTMLGSLNLKAVYHRAVISDTIFIALKAGGGVSLLKSDINYKDGSGVNIDIGYNKTPAFLTDISSARSVSDGAGSTGSAISENKTSFYPCVQGGISFVWMPFTRFSLEAGADFTHIFISNMPTGIITPYVALGFKF
ncbi:MAG: hypothetical protein IJ158_08000 [Treponema sp.]|nr:hypothetical protein [Treponema sp.]